MNLAYVYFDIFTLIYSLFIILRSLNSILQQLPLVVFASLNQQKCLHSVRPKLQVLVLELEIEWHQINRGETLMYLQLSIVYKPYDKQAVIFGLRI